MTVIAGALLLTGVSSAAPVDVYLQTQTFLKDIPDGLGGTIEARMWGFASCVDNTFTGCSVDAPGPRIDATDADSLTIHLNNTLAIPVSLMIPGQAGGGDPVDLPSDTRRARSMTHETASGATGTYYWATLRPGTYLYQSGTAPSLQVPMGLYGALIVTSGSDPYSGVSVSSEATLLFSEVDPIQNQRVHAAASGGNPTAACVPIDDYAEHLTDGYPCSVDYFPALTLVNGEPTADTSSLTSGTTGLLRLLNAGQRTHVPAIVGVELGLIAEDGNLYPGNPRVQNQASLTAGKTLDALISAPAGNVTLAVFDRGPAYKNENLPNGGGIGGVVVGTGSLPPVAPTVYAVNDIYAVPEDANPYSGASVLSNDVGLGGASVSLNTSVSNGTLVLNANGTFSYTPNANFSGTDAFTYSATLAGNVYPAQVNLNVSFVNDAPVAHADGPYVNAIGSTITIDAAHGVLGNDSDPDGDALTAIVFGSPPAGLSLHPDGSFTYSGGAPSFMYRAYDGSAYSAAVEVELTSNPVANITLAVHDPASHSVGSYRWIVQEDATFHVDPQNPGDPADMLSVSFHKSYMPVVAQGCVGIECATGTDTVPIASFNQVALDPSKHYYVSVLPNDAGDEGHTIGGAQILPGTSNTTVDVVVNNQPTPQAQISVIVFEDTAPTNGVPDPGEAGLGGFEIVLEDAAGRYGQSPGVLSQNAFGEPLKNSLDCFDGAPPPPTGVILTCPDGTALIKDLPPGKFGVIVVPAAGTGTWTQTSTIEGTNVQDTWVKAGEPPFLVEFGAPGYHAFIGFVNPEHTNSPGGTNAISGSVTMLHSARPPVNTGFDSGSYDALGHTRAWIGVNSINGNGSNISTVQAEPDGSFTIPNLPDGTYQLAIWDEYLDQIIYYQTVTVPGGGNVGNIPVPTWFGRHEHNVFLDTNENGVRDEGEVGLPDQNVNLRFRDGTVFQSFPTDTTGFVPFDQVFPFGAWQVAEVDFARFKATGVTITVDGGGDVSGGLYPGLLNPQAGSPRTETDPAPVLLEGFQSMPGMTSIFEWGKAPYAPGENGGISGIVFYGSTRGENDPRLTVGDTWEPGIPGVTVRLFREIATEGGGTTLAFVDEVQTDSWDANAADVTGCPGEPVSNNPFVTDTLNGDLTRCFDGIRNFEQVRPGAVFDGGYAFGDIAPGAYVVEVVPPPGYQIIKEEDKNVDFGDAFEMAPVPMMFASAMLVTLPDSAMVSEALLGKDWGLAQPPCVGADHEVPATLSLFPGKVDTYAPYAGAMRPLCNRKRLVLEDQGQAAADFHLFTSTPVAGQFQGLTTDDIAVEGDPASPQYGDKWGPAYLPITMRDYNGAVVYHGYTDAFGHFNGLVPSTYSANVPIPSGYSPNMHSVCLNEPFLPSGALDPLHNPGYGAFCYTLMYMPGTTTYLDTPILPQAAFAAGFNPVDCALPDGHPVVVSVNPLVAPGGTLTINSQGTTAVPNPDYEGPLSAHNMATINRDYGFGGGGTVMLGTTALQSVSWSNGTITGTVPVSLAPGAYELSVVRNNGSRSINTVTVTVSGAAADALVNPGPGTPIQDAIDAADPGDLILVAPGTYNELVVMWKPVRLQGSGANTIINAVKLPPEKLAQWLDKVQGLVDGGDVDLLPGQPDQVDLVGPGLFAFEWGGGITVLAKNDGSWNTTNAPRIDGFTITGADGGGGVFVNGYAHNLEISNNNITGNSGIRHGGIRIGHPFLPLVGDGPFGFNTNVDIHHNSVTLNGSQGDDAVAGGIGICTGADNYRVAYNYICGNFSIGDGGGFGHRGLSDNGVFEFNQVLFNQNFNQGLAKAGGGLFVGGEPPAAGATLSRGAGDVEIDANLVQGNQAGSGNGGGLSTEFYNGLEITGPPGGQGGQPFGGWHLRVTNNMFVNNVAAGWGAGIALEETVFAEIILNTIANNDTTGTAGSIIGTGEQPSGIASVPFSVALAERVAEAKPGNADPTYADPTLTHNVIWHNRAFTYDDATNPPRLLPVLNPGSPGACTAGAHYADLGVIGGGSLTPVRNILTSTQGYGGLGNSSQNPLFVKQYCNGARQLSTVGPLQVAAEPVEGGNFVSVFFGPLTREWPAASGAWNYHLTGGSPAINYNSSQPNNQPSQPSGPNVDHDIDSQVRPRQQGPRRVDLGADEYYPAQ